MVKPVITTRARPIPGVPHHHHEVLLNGKVIHRQISALGADDVANAVARHEEAKRQAKALRANPTTYACRTCGKEKPGTQYRWLGTWRVKHCIPCAHKLRKEGVRT